MEYDSYIYVTENTWWKGLHYKTYVYDNLVFFLARTVIDVINTLQKVIFLKMLFYVITASGLKRIILFNTLSKEK